MFKKTKPRFVFDPEYTRGHSPEFGGRAATTAKGAQAAGRVHARGSGGFPQAVDSVSRFLPDFVFRCLLLEAGFSLPSFL